MAINSYFNFFPQNTTSEQNLVEDLVIEALKIYGMDVYYLPRSNGNLDHIFGEDQLKYYTSANLIEMYLENVLSMEGAGDFMSKFGLEIRDECTLLVARKRFTEKLPSMFRPLEGDLIYIPMVQNFFEITSVEHENDQAMFYTLGKGRGGNVYVYALKLKQYTLSNELIMTGVKEVDNQIRDNYLRTRIFLEDIAGTFSNNEIVFSGNTYNTRTAEAIVHYHANTYMDVYRTIGNLTGVITGNTSGNTATVTSKDDMVTLDNPFEDVIDNNRIETQADLFIDWSEKNPLGDA
jgi:hypothetical protein